MSKKLEDWQVRVLDESNDLSAKLGDLTRFLSSDAGVAQDELDLLKLQRSAMYLYNDALLRRIERFQPVGGLADSELDTTPCKS